MTPSVLPRLALRTCVGCRRRRPQGELVRIAAPYGMLMVSRTAPGRGAWLCADEDCTARALATRGFERSLRRPVDDAALRPQLTPADATAGATAPAK